MINKAKKNPIVNKKIKILKSLLIRINLKTIKLKKQQIKQHKKDKQIANKKSNTKFINKTRNNKQYQWKVMRILKMKNKRRIMIKLNKKKNMRMSFKINLIKIMLIKTIK